MLPVSGLRIETSWTALDRFGTNPSLFGELRVPKILSCAGLKLTKQPH